MDNKENIRICDQCYKEVAEANFALHESHCHRFLCLCPDCDEPVPREQLKQHRLDEHTQVKCSKCYQKVERCHLMDHESDECEERLQCCDFCQLELPWRDLREHSVACGSRTELCHDCGRYVTLKDQLEHAQACPGTGTKTISVPPNAIISAPTKRQTSVICRRCMASFPDEDIEEHKLECVSTSWRDLEEAEKEEEEDNGEGGLFVEEVSPRLTSSLKAASLSDRPRREALADGGDPDQISTCAYCHLALPLFTLRWHEVKCKLHIHLK
ncbi:XIAP-associated factor 1 [Polymixia lowei]